MIGVDTNVLVRYFAKDDPVQAASARAFFERQARDGESIRVGLVVLTELAWVLRTRYGASRAELGRVVDELLTDRRVDVQDRQAVAVAIYDFMTSTADFADLLIAAVNTLHRCVRTVTFDRAAARIEGMELLA